MEYYDDEAYRAGWDAAQAVMMEGVSDWDALYRAHGEPQAGDPDDAYGDGWRDAVAEVRSMTLLANARASRAGGAR